jgi:hypothetical protein
VIVEEVFGRAGHLPQREKAVRNVLHGLVAFGTQGQLAVGVYVLLGECLGRFVDAAGGLRLRFLLLHRLPLLVQKDTAHRFEWKNSLITALQKLQSYKLAACPNIPPST